MSSLAPTVQTARPSEPLSPAALLHPTNVATAEIANSITHGLGLVLSIIAAVVLMEAAWHTDGWRLTACGVYVGTMISVYATSTLSHVFAKPRLKRLFRMLDQGCIYLFIVGTFTPIAATFLRGSSWWILLAAMWAIAIAGFLSKVILMHRLDAASVIVPVLLGWMPLMGGPAMLNLVPSLVVWWVLAGGVCYTVGTLFLVFDHRHRYLHSLWHLWVIAGSACHFWAILHFTVPAM